MTDQFRITIAQLNPTVGDLQRNAAKAKQAWLQGAEQGSDFVTLPEMFITGYNTQDLTVLRWASVVHGWKMEHCLTPISS